MKHDYFRTFARYNQWANRRLYAACAALPEAEYMKPRAAFFGSLHATLNPESVFVGTYEYDPAPIVASASVKLGWFADL